jgi:hypothetical protein
MWPRAAAAFLPRSLMFLTLSLPLSCGGASSSVATAAPTGRGAGQGGVFPDDPRAILRYRSPRFKLSVPLPDGHTWEIDDHRGRVLVASHAPTRSTLTVYSSAEPELMNRQSCEAHARQIGLFALRDPRTVADEVTVGPDAYDTRIWIALEAGTSPGSPLTGHAFLFGAYVRKCLFVHYETSVERGVDEPLLTSRLATARLLILAGMRMEPFDEPVRAVKSKATP